MNNRQIRFFSLLALIMCLGIACKSKIPKDVIAPKEMKSLLFEITVAEQIKQLDTSTATKAHPRDSATLAIRKVLAIHHVSREDYMKSLDFYNANPNILKELLDSAKAYGTELQDSLRSKKNKAERLKQQDTSKKNVDSTKSAPSRPLKKDSARAVQVPNKPVVPLEEPKTGTPGGKKL